MGKYTKMTAFAASLMIASCSGTSVEQSETTPPDVETALNDIPEAGASDMTKPSGPPPSFMKKVDMSDIENQHLNVAYADDSAAQVLDVFIPEGDGPFPAVVLIHGGAFKMGSKEMDYGHARALLDNGYVAISINYRLSGEAVFPAAVHDSKAAIRFIRANADTYKIDANNIGAWGASAGGNLTAMMATSSGDAFAEGEVGDYLDTSAGVDAAINWFGPMNFSTMVPEGLELGFQDSYNVDLESSYIGMDAMDPANIDVVIAANPTTYLDPSDPPIWTVVGDADPLIPYTQSINFYEAAKAAIGEDKATFTLLEGAGHGGPQFEDPALLQSSVEFFDKYLKE